MQFEERKQRRQVMQNDLLNFTIENAEINLRFAGSTFNEWRVKRKTEA